MLHLAAAKAIAPRAMLRSKDSVVLNVRTLLSVCLISALFVLSGCESSEKRAERYYQSGLALIAAGDEDRALVELRNVFRYNAIHKDARKLYADLQLKRGNLFEAYSQYLLLVEQYPDLPDVRQILAEVAIGRGDWDEAERHGREAIRLAPSTQPIMAIKAALDYRDGQKKQDLVLQAASVDLARQVLASSPENIVARRVVIEDLLVGVDPQSAMPEINLALQYNSEMIELHVLKLQLLIDRNEPGPIGTQLQIMAEKFPENEKVRAGLVAWYLDQNKPDEAEAYLRQLSVKLGDDPTAQMNVVRLLQQTKGPEAAGKELDALILSHADKPNAATYQSLRASIDFENGRQAEAIAALVALVDSTSKTDETRSIKVMLAKMHELSGDSEAARARVDEVLAEDRSNIEALKMKATWLIDADKPSEAIIALRTALDQNPRDPEILTLMATAHERDGSPELAGERLALAVEVTGSAAKESLRYAAFLLENGNDLSAARSILLDALANAPTDLEVVRGLAQILVLQRDWARAMELVTTLRSMQQADSGRTADSIEAAVLLGQEKTEQSITFLQDMIDKGQGDVSSIAIIIQTQIRAGKTAEARSYLNDALAKTPDNVGLRFLSGNLYSMMGETAPAEKIFRALIADDASAEPVVQSLYALLKSQGRHKEATDLLDQSIANYRESMMLRWIKAGELEASGDIEGAIAVYEELYAEDSGNLVVANNLASLIATNRTDPNALERAYAIAKRLKGNPTPAFQDTIGWIEFRRGSPDDALLSIEPAAKKLTTDPMVQLHLGMVYNALGRFDEAKATLTQALQLAGESKLPAFDEARSLLAKLASAPAPSP